MSRLILTLAMAVAVMACGKGTPTPTPPTPSTMQPADPSKKMGDIFGPTSGSVTITGTTITQTPATISLGSTLPNPAGCLVANDAGSCHLTSVSVNNESTTAEWCGLYALGACPSVWDSGTGPIEVFPVSAGLGSYTMLGNDHFGAAGLGMSSGCTIACSSTPPGDGGGGVGTFTAAKNLDISAFGYSP